ncbi:MAG TPA: MEDS domain-containing protein [Nitrospiraceae bacterium]|nr:MEDS domain-containing protein [Nitrospiraceae bacterium]
MSHVELEEQISTMQQGDHLCLVYEDQTEQMAAAVPFIRDGLGRGERCLYVADDLTLEEVSGALAAGGTDLAEERKRGALILLTKREAYLRSGMFDPEAMVNFLRRAVDQALAEGFSGFRVTGEMAWAWGPEAGCERLIEYEALLNKFFPAGRATAICQYNRRRFAPSVIHGVLRTHPIAILGDQVCPNPYYEHPDMVLEDGRDAARVDWLISQLKRVRAANRLQDELNLHVAERARQAALAADIGRALAGHGDLPRKLQRCTEAVVRHLDAAFSRIWTLNGAQHILELQASSGLYLNLDGRHSRVPVGELKIGLIAKERKPHLTNQVVSDPRVNDQQWAEREGMVAFAGYPLMVGDRLVGVMALFARHALSESTMSALASIADQVAVGIERERAEDEIRTLNASLKAQVKAYQKSVQDLKQSQAELYEKIDDLEQFEQAVVGRELKMIELEQEVKRLREELKRIW